MVNQKEYWEYLYSGSKWNCSKDGLLVILLDCFREIKRRNWLNFEYATQSMSPSVDEDTLSDLLLIVTKIVFILFFIFF